MRPTCTYCARKHIGQASVLLGESRLGYPEHVWLAIGHLAEASEELVVAHPALANEIRAHRKALESAAAEGRTYDVPVIDLLSRISALGMPAKLLVEQPGTTPPAQVIAPPMHPADVAVAGCLPCEAARDKARREAARIESTLIGTEGRHIGRLVIISPLSDFHPAYSLCSVILDQAHAALMAGYRVHVWVNKGCNVSKLPALPPGLTVDALLPQVTLSDDVVVEANVVALVEALTVELTPFYHAGAAPRVITHDLVFQSWYVDYAVAMHRLAARGYGEKDGSTWWHVVHSSVGARPTTAVARWRATIPVGHRLLAVNYADVPHLRGYYQVPANEHRIDTLLNPRDPRVFLQMTETASLLVTKHGLLHRDVVQIYPLSGTRMMAKGVDKLVQLFGAMATAGADVVLLIANAHSNNDDTKHTIRHLRALAAASGLSEEALVFTSESMPATEATGLDGNSIRSLFAISNLFAFPTTSEAGSLVLLEAMMSQCLLVLNDSLPCLYDYVPRNLGIWVPWGSVKGQGQAFNQADVAQKVLDRLALDERFAVRRALFERSSIEAYGANLHEILQANVPVAGAP